MTRSEIACLLPGTFQRVLSNAPGGAVLSAFLSVMEALHEQPEHQIAEFDRICDPFRTPDTFVPLLAGWVGLGPVVDATRGGNDGDDRITTGLGRLRALTADAAALAKWRGTGEGLCRFLETATGLLGFTVAEVQNETADRSFHLHVTAPAAARPHRALIARAIDFERPAYCTWSLTFDESTAPQPQTEKDEVDHVA